MVYRGQIAAKEEPEKNNKATDSEQEGNIFKRGFEAVQGG